MPDNNIDAETLLQAYAQGFFPMAQAENDPQILWYNPDPRTILSLDEPLYLNRSNQRLWRQHDYRLTLNQDFRQVMLACRENRDGCWISDKLVELYVQAHGLGYALSLECWHEDRLVGGIYGIALGGVFCGESMFSRKSGAGKVALIAMHQTLRKAGYQLFDVQYSNEHLEQFRTTQISRESYLQQLDKALNLVPHELDISVR